MSGSQEYLERERRRLDEQAQQLAKDKACILPKPRHAEPAHTADPTMRDFRKWQWSILALLLLVNLGYAIELSQAPPESIRIIVEERQVTRLQDEATGEISYLVKVRGDDLGPYIGRSQAPPVQVWTGANVLLIAALAYTRYRMRHANRAAREQKDAPSAMPRS